MNSRDKLAHWITALVDEIAPGYEAKYGAPMGWCSTLASDIGDHLAELRETERQRLDGCAVCGKPLTQPATGRRRRYCPRPAPCRDRASRPERPATSERRREPLLRPVRAQPHLAVIDNDP